MDNIVNTDGTATIPPQGSLAGLTMETAGPCLLGTVQALLDDDGDGRMLPEHRDKAISEANRFAEKILSAYVTHYGHPPVARPRELGPAPDRTMTGLLYGCVQSGKTRAITLTSALLFDNGIRIVVVLTSNNVELVEQTADRLMLVEGVQFLTSLEHDKERWERVTLTIKFQQKKNCRMP